MAARASCPPSTGRLGWPANCTDRAPPIRRPCRRRGRCQRFRSRSGLPPKRRIEAAPASCCSGVIRWRRSEVLLWAYSASVFWSASRRSSWAARIPDQRAWTSFGTAGGRRPRGIEVVEADLARNPGRPTRPRRRTVREAAVAAARRPRPPGRTPGSAWSASSASRGPGPRRRCRTSFFSVARRRRRTASRRTAVASWLLVWSSSILERPRLCGWQKPEALVHLGPQASIRGAFAGEAPKRGDRPLPGGRRRPGSGPAPAPRPGGSPRSRGRAALTGPVTGSPSSAGLVIATAYRAPSASPGHRGVRDPEPEDAPDRQGEERSQRQPEQVRGDRAAGDLAHRLDRQDAVDHLEPGRQLAPAGT